MPTSPSSDATTTTADDSPTDLDTPGSRNIPVERSTCPTSYVPLCRRAGQAPPHARYAGVPLRCKRCLHHLKQVPRANVGFLNLHGARKLQKWEELYRTLTVKGCTFCRSGNPPPRLGKPPTHHDWQWAGNNRSTGDRQGEGVGVLWWNSLTWKQLQGDCREYMWIAGKILNILVLTGVVYLSVTQELDTNNCQIMKCIRDDVARWGVEKEVLLIGDFNGHIQPLDGYQNVNRSFMLQLAEELSLEIADLRTHYEGVLTWCA
ncbi:hypothetical protein HPB50_007961 [Hyalomma asiaticum]|uniref:Uncharacterized protein n=1 Tax=Hyalomma asiaticum TaxID=266040 RepID=A0ACB7S5X3_HYAAI|nr:hypothetical protein HPB50_007961 [Hyalomma asiaticum]